MGYVVQDNECFDSGTFDSGTFWLWDVLTWDVLTLGCFDLGRFDSGTFWLRSFWLLDVLTWDALTLGRFDLGRYDFGTFWFGTFWLWDVLTWDVLTMGRFDIGTFWPVTVSRIRTCAFCAYQSSLWRDIDGCCNQENGHWNHAFSFSLDRHRYLAANHCCTELKLDGWLRLGIKHYLFSWTSSCVLVHRQTFSGWSWKLVPTGTRGSTQDTEKGIVIYQGVHCCTKACNLHIHQCILHAIWPETSQLWNIFCSLTNLIWKVV